ncbi:hypothetical protein KC316_g17935 [Hortaea werneckii]|nr:hypothetical protein KC316_g17935 [Hortaea werneckii]
MGLGWGEAVPVDTHVWQIAQRDYKFGRGKHSSLTKQTYDAVGAKFRSLWGQEAGWAHSVLFTADLRAFSERLIAKKEEQKEEVEVKTEAGAEVEEDVTKVDKVLERGVKREPEEEEKKVVEVEEKVISGDIRAPFSVGNMRLRAAAVSAALLVARAKAQQAIQVSSAPHQRYPLTNSLPYDSAMNCQGEIPSTLPKDCSGPYSGTGYVGDFVDACGVDYAVHCGMRIDSDPFAAYEDVSELSKCMEACDRFPNCTSATHLGSRCLLDASASMKAVHGHPELAALIKGSYRGMRMQTAPPSMVREYRRQASRTTVNPAAATVPVCPNSNGQLYEDDYGALYIINCGAYNTGTNYTILWSRDSGCTTLRCCMDYCDGFQDCFGTALLLGTQNSTDPVALTMAN